MQGRARDARCRVRGCEGARVPVDVSETCCDRPSDRECQCECQRKTVGKSTDNNTYRPVPKQKKKKTKKKKATVGCCDVCDAVQCYAIAVGTMEDPNG